MTDKKVTVTRHKKFQLRGTKNLFPTINFTGGRAHEPGEKIEFDAKKLDRAKVAWCTAYAAGLKLAADSTTDGVERDLVYWQEVMTRENPEFAALPKEVQAYQARLKMLGYGKNEQLDGALDQKRHNDLAYLNGNQRDTSEAGGAWGYTDPAATWASSLASKAPGMLKLPAMLAANVPDALRLNGAMRANEPLTRDGQVKNRGETADLAAALRKRMSDTVAETELARQQAEASGDTAALAAIQAKRQTASQTSLADIAKEHVSSRAPEAVGNRLSESLLGRVGGASTMALTGVGANLIPLTTEAGRQAWAEDPTGMAASAAKNTSIALAPSVAAWQGLRAPTGNVPLPRLTPPTALQRMGDGVKSLLKPGSMRATATGAGRMATLGAGARNLVRGGAIAGTVAGGITGVRDLANLATDDGQTRQQMEAELRTTALANQATGKGEKLTNAVGAGVGAVLGGNLTDARREVGAAYGRFDWAKNLPMGRVYQDAMRDSGSQQAAQQAYETALRTLKLNPELANLDAESLDGLAQAAAGRAFNLGQLNHGRDFDKRTGGEWLERYSAARAAAMKGDPTPDQVSYLEELNRAPLPRQNGKVQWTPEVDQATGRQVSLYNQLDRGTTQQLQRQLPPPAAPAAPAPTPTAPQPVKPVGAPEPLAAAPQPIKPIGTPT